MLFLYPHSYSTRYRERQRFEGIEMTTQSFLLVLPLIHPLRSKPIHIYIARKQTTPGFIQVIQMRDIITLYTLLAPVVLPPRLQRSTARVLLDADRRPQPTEGVQLGWSRHHHGLTVLLPWSDLTSRSDCPMTPST